MYTDNVLHKTRAYIKRCAYAKHMNNFARESS